VTPDRIPLNVTFECGHTSVLSVHPNSAVARGGSGPLELMCEECSGALRFVEKVTP
jgi:hypothetical protein